MIIAIDNKKFQENLFKFEKVFCPSEKYKLDQFV